MLKKRLVVGALLLIMALTASITVSSVQASSWHLISDWERNALILNAARSKIGTIGGQCKEWVQNLVYKASGYVLFLPSNFICPGHVYHLAKWREDQSGSRYCYVVWQAAYICFGSFVGWGIRPGNIIQMRHTAGGCLPHTAIIECVYADRLVVIDSNWKSDGVVRRHDITIQWFNQYVQAWTVYQLK